MEYRVRHRPSQIYRANLISFVLLYFVQGLPYGLQTKFLPIYFRIHGMSLTSVGLYKLLLVPWVMKTIWAPIIDTYGQRKTWLIWTLLSLVVLSVVAAHTPPSNLTLLALVLFMFNMATSVNDIALDALVMEVLLPSQVLAGNIAQVVGYKAGTVFSGGIFSWLTGTIAWEHIFYSMAFIYFLGCIVSLVYLPDASTRRDSSSTTTTIVPPSSDDTALPQQRVHLTRADLCRFLNIFTYDGTPWTLAYVLVYKIGEQGVMNMFPMFLLDEGIPAATVGFWTGLIAQILSLIGSSFGGLYDIGSMLASLQFQNIVRAASIVVMWLCILVWKDMTYAAYVASITALLVLYLVSGAITTCTFTLVMQLSQKAPRRCRASHYTLLATAEVLGKLLFSAAVGALAETMGYSTVFALFSVLSLVPVPMVFFAPSAVVIETYIDITE